MTIGNVNPHGKDPNIQEKQKSSIQESLDAVVQSATPIKRGSSLSTSKKIWRSFTLSFASRSFQKLSKDLNLTKEQSLVLMEIDTETLIKIKTIPGVQELILEATQNEDPTILRQLNSLYKEGKLQKSGERLPYLIGMAHQFNLSLSEIFLLGDMDETLLQNIKTAYQSSPQFKKEIIECIKNQDQKAFDLLESFSNLDPIITLVEKGNSLKEAMAMLNHLGALQSEKLEVFHQQCTRLNLNSKQRLEFSKIDSNSRDVISSTFHDFPASFKESLFRAAEQGEGLNILELSKILSQSKVLKNSAHILAQNNFSLSEMHAVFTSNLNSSDIFQFSELVNNSSVSLKAPLMAAIRKNEFQSFLRLYNRVEDRDTLFKYLQSSSSPSMSCLEKLKELNLYDKVFSFQSNHRVFSQLVDMIDKNRIVEIADLCEMNPEKIDSYTKLELPLIHAPFLEKHFNDALSEIFHLYANSSISPYILSALENKNFEGLRKILTSSQEHVDEITRFAKEKGFSVSKESLQIEGAALSQTPIKTEDLKRKISALNEKQLSILGNFLSHGLPISTSLYMINTYSSKELKVLMELLPNEDLKNQLLNEITDPSFIGIDPHFFEAAAYFDEIIPDIQKLSGNRFNQKELNAMKTAVALAAVNMEGTKSLKESLNEFLKQAKDIQNQRPFVPAYEEVSKSPDPNLLTAFADIINTPGLQKTSGILLVILDMTLCINSQTLQYAIEGSYNHYSRTIEDFTTRFKNIENAVATVSHPCIDLTDKEENEVIDCKHLRPEIHFVDPLTQETYSLTMELPFEGKMSVEELKYHLKILDLIIRGEHKRDPKILQEHEKKYPEITSKIWSFSKKFMDSYVIGGVSFSASENCAKGWGRLTTPHTKHLETVETPTPLDLSRAAAEGHIYKTEKDTLSLTPPEKASMSHPISLDQLKDSVNQAAIPCSLPILENGEIKEIPGVVQLNAGQIEWGIEATPLLRIRATYQAGESSTVRDSYYQLLEGESENEAVSRVLNSPDFERENLLDYSKYLRERLDEHDAY